MSRYKINNLEEYFKEYKKSVREPRKFWDKIASENFTWYQEWEKWLISIWHSQNGLSMLK
jgi:acetyl-CoA synthetase